MNIHEFAQWLWQRYPDGEGDPTPEDEISILDALLPREEEDGEACEPRREGERWCDAAGWS